MLIETILAVASGIFLGIITGLTPGVHINLVAAILLALSARLSGFISTYYLAVSILAMSITHVFLDSIPSVFLGAPDTDQVLTVLPGHRLLLNGTGYKAVALISLGALCAILLAIIISPLTIIFIKKTFELIRPYIGIILIIVSILLIIKEQKSKFWAFILFCMSGILGLAVFNIHSLREPLFPMLSGLFGISTLIISISEKAIIPIQYKIFPKLGIWKAGGLTLLATVASSLFSFLPGLGPTQATILASSLAKNLQSESFLFLNGGINAVNMLTSVLSLYAIDKARNGSIVIISKMIELTKENLVIFLIIAAVTAIIAFFLSLLLALLFAKMITKINYSWLCTGIIAFVVALVFYFSGFVGLLVLTSATLLGIIPSIKGAGKNHLMGCLLIPVISYFIL
ncbi:MAG: tripartite tricarboxylate transporter permease [Nanoarchaeota archaeon]